MFESRIGFILIYYSPPILPINVHALWLHISKNKSMIYLYLQYTNKIASTFPHIQHILKIWYWYRWKLQPITKWQISNNLLMTTLCWVSLGAIKVSDIYICLMNQGAWQFERGPNEYSSRHPVQFINWIMADLPF